MKKSEYNIFAVKNNCVLGYNTISFSYLAVLHSVYDKFYKYHVENFKDEYPEIYENFAVSGFIIEDSKGKNENITLKNGNKTL
jgi:hypothetical protein